MIGIIKSEMTITHNFAEWLENEKRVLFVTGLSGSGKTTIAKELASDFNAKVVSLDQYIKKLIRTNTGNPSPNYEEIAFKEGVEMLLADNPEGRLVIEGAQVSWLNPERLKEHGVLCFRTSLLTSCWRACRRDLTKEHWQKWKRIAPQLHIGYNLRTFGAMKAFAKAL